MERFSIYTNLITDSINALDNQVKKYILEKKNEFLKIVKANSLPNDLIYDFLIESETNENGNIIYTHLVAYSFSGGAHYTREDKTFIYDKEKQKFLNITDFLNSENAFTSLTLLVRDIFKNYVESEKIKTIDEEWLSVGTEATLENYQHFYLNANGMTIIFPPYQIASWADGEIKITIPVKDISPILKEKYYNELKINETEKPSLKIEKELMICI